jgi:signal recognition particle subunit SRP19
MASRDLRGRRVVVWPVYIDESASRGEGRRVPRRVAVRRPTVEEIYRAARDLGLNPEIAEIKYPRMWWVYDRAVIVDKVAPKTRILRAIAERIRQLRSG